MQMTTEQAAATLKRMTLKYPELAVISAGEPGPEMTKAFMRFRKTMPRDEAREVDCAVMVLRSALQLPSNN